MRNVAEIDMRKSGCWGPHNRSGHGKDFIRVLMDPNQGLAGLKWGHLRHGACKPLGRTNRIQVHSVRGTYHSRAEDLVRVRISDVRNLICVSLIVDV